MENQSSLDNVFNIEVDQAVKQTLETIALWAKVVAISAFISYGISVISVFMNKDLDNEVIGKSVMLFFTFLSAVIGVMINYFLLKFSNETKAGILAADQIRLDSGFNNLRIYFKILGIFLIIFLSFFVLALLLGGFGAMVNG